MPKVPRVWRSGVVPGWKQLHRVEVGTDRPAYRVLDLASVPAVVRERWSARKVPLKPGTAMRFYPQQLLGRNFIRSGVVATGVGGTAVAADVATAAVVFPSNWIGLIGDGTAGIVFGTVFAVGGVGASIAGLRYWRDPRRLRKADRAAAQKAVWITPADLGFRRMHGIARSTDEERLFHLSVRIAERIAATNSWKSPLLDSHPARLDLDENVGQIGRRLLEIRRLRTELETSRSPATQPVVEEHVRSLDAAFASLAARVVTMHDYLEQLRELDGRLWQLEQIERANSLSDRVLDVMAATAGDEHADEQLRELKSDTEVNAETVDAILSDLAVTVDYLETDEK
ncbi:hypothetical protein LWF01_04270 [Saxibacter everestensis]|uniref:5-bromo-4-chloroindolyl phosphate hydrolysis protein n=1 Tax=Saxibacter everestensis TaxID=2909229 RepID=A0ABY8QW06_9MICO|nr:hypothetical protein LWF01_04270 [Brevibacteriaceae bacterium ZFBP1038]